MSTILELLQNRAIIAAGSVLGMALIDFVYAINPNSKANGLIHLIYLFFSNESESEEPKAGSKTK